MFFRKVETVTTTWYNNPKEGLHRSKTTMRTLNPSEMHADNSNGKFYITHL